MKRAPLRLLRLIVFLCVAEACAAEDPAFVLGQLRAAIGRIPWSAASGYSLAGRFTLKLPGDELTYDATFLRQQKRWAADFRNPDASWNIRYVAGQICWASTPELTERLERPQLPYVAEYDFPELWADLTGILESAGAPPFRIESDANDIYIHGKLRTGAEATFLLNRVQWFPRKVSISAGSKPRPAWILPALQPDRSASFLALPYEVPKTFEVWFSDFVDLDGCRYPQRTDFVDEHGVRATFVLERVGAGSLREQLYEPPGQMPSVALLPGLTPVKRERRSLYLDENETQAFRQRVGSRELGSWRRLNAIAAAWTLAALPLSHLSPAAVTPSMLGLTLAVIAGGFVVLRIRSGAQFQRAGMRFLLVFAAFLTAVLAVGIASIQLSSPRGRSLSAIHTALRYRITGSAVYARMANRLLLDIPAEAAPANMAALADSCRDYAAAYDLVRPALAPQRQSEIRAALFSIATPLFSALTGWRANTPEAPALASGLGLVGMAIDFEPFVATARSVLDKSLERQFEAGGFRAGPGPGAFALDRAADLFFAFKHTGAADYYAVPAVREHVDTLVQLLSPAGTLPLFGETTPDDSLRSARFLTKVAAGMPDPLRGRCVEAAEAYWSRGRYLSRGTPKLLGTWLRPAWFFLREPSLLFQHDPHATRSALAGASAVLGGGRIAVLRSGVGPDALYLAVNAGRNAWTANTNDVLGIDLYGYSSLLLHGPGHPAKGRPGYEDSFKTAAANSLTFEDEGQVESVCAGVTASILNQELYDYVRVFADTSYDLGQVERDAVMIRPEGNLPGYFVLMDTVRTNSPATRVSWFLHGRGEMTRGVDQLAKWECPVLSAPGLRSRNVPILAWICGGGELSSIAGKLYSRAGPAQPSETIVRRWVGPKRFSTILFPLRPGMPAPVIETTTPSKVVKIGETDWVALGDSETRVVNGRLQYAAESVVTRDRGRDFPGVLMVSGVEFGLGPHSLTSSKPLTVSLRGLNGTLVTPLPDTEVEIRSPQIRDGQEFLLDDATVLRAEGGMLRFMIPATGPHRLKAGVRF
jgi:hypothetical protein